MNLNYLFQPIAEFNLRNNIHGIVNSYRQFRVSKTKGEKRSSRCMKPGGGNVVYTNKGSIYTPKLLTSYHINNNITFK